MDFDGTTSGRDFFNKLYEQDAVLEAQWLAFGARHKADSVETLLNDHCPHPATLLELGCGTGALSLECQRRGLARAFFAADFSASALDALNRSSHTIATWRADISSPPYPFPRDIDVLLLSHVLEHLEDPRSTLLALRTHMAFRFALIEVPLEDLLASRIKGHFRDRKANTSGHVQFFTQRSVDALITGCGFRIVATRRYVPELDDSAIALQAMRKGGAYSAMRMKAGRLASRALRPVWSQPYYSHYAALCVPA